MNDDEIAQLNLFSALAMPALIINRNMDSDSRDLAIRSVEIAEDLMVEIETARDRAED